MDGGLNRDVKNQAGEGSEGRVKKKKKNTEQWESDNKHVALNPCVEDKNMNN